MKRILLVALLIVAPIAVASTKNNDDGCDIGQYPAATLLLPFFEVETAQRRFDTLFTVTNVSQFPQIAHVTIWTDWSFPVLTFNVFLTGYDVQSISLYDVLVNGIIAPANPNLTAGGTSSTNAPGSLSAANDANPNLVTAGCEELPGLVIAPLRLAVQSALISGTYSAPSFANGCGKSAVGSPASTHRTATTAVGYVTIDVSSRCSPSLPTDPGYYASEILFDNVLTGDYAAFDQVAGSNYAGGNPLVHIRAIPEGGPAGAFPASKDAAATPLPYTFYGRFINGQTIGGVPMIAHLDRRQPLGSTFAARWIQGGPTSFSTSLKIWREGVAGPTTCANAASNSALKIAEIIRFDEHENPNDFSVGYIQYPPPPPTLPATSSTQTASGGYPTLNSPAGDSSGWMYLNLDSEQSDRVVNAIEHPAFTSRRPSQNWVVVSMTGAGSTAGLFGVEFDATSLGNGCSPATPQSFLYFPTIGPAGGALVCPPGFNVGAGSQPCVSGKPPYTGTNVNP